MLFSRTKGCICSFFLDSLVGWSIVVEGSSNHQVGRSHELPDKITLQSQRPYLTKETRMLLTLMKFRAVGLIHAELSKSPATAQQYNDLVESELAEQQFTESVGNLLVQTIKQKLAFGGSLPMRLFLEMNSILWQQVTDLLIEDSECEYNNFGIFRATLRPGVLRLDFIPSAVVRESAPPEPMNSEYGGEVLADEYCRSAMDPIRQLVLGTPDSAAAGEWSLPLAAPRLLTGGLNEVWRNFISKGILPARVEGDEDWLTLLAMGASFATYYAWTVAFGIALAGRSEVVFEGVGKFQRRGETVAFAVNPPLSKLLRQNIAREKERQRIVA